MRAVVRQEGQQDVGGGKTRKWQERWHSEMSEAVSEMRVIARGWRSKMRRWQDGETKEVVR